MLDFGSCVKWLVVYIAVANGPETTDYCSRFGSTWTAFPPGIDCEIVVACNGGPISKVQAEAFWPLKPLFFPRPNDNGYDITAYQDAALKFDCDAMCCCGQSVYFHRSGWLKRYDEAWQKFGPGMYGTFSSNLVRQHLNTTGFCIAPDWLNAWPRPQNRKDRYDFEHGTSSISRLVKAQGKPVKLVTWSGIYDSQHWRTPENIMWRGNQSNCLMWCSHTERWFDADSETQTRWSKGADFGGQRL